MHDPIYTQHANSGQAPKCEMRHPFDSQTMPDMARPKGTADELIEIGERIGRARAALGLSKADLARQLQVPPNTWQGYEDGTRTPPPLLMARWANLSGVTLEWIYRGRLETLPAWLATAIEGATRSAG